MKLDDGWGYPDPGPLCEFLVHGLKYVFTPGARRADARDGHGPRGAAAEPSC